MMAAHRERYVLCWSLEAYIWRTGHLKGRMWTLSVSFIACVSEGSAPVPATSNLLADFCRL